MPGPALVPAEQNHLVAGRGGELASDGFADGSRATGQKSDLCRSLWLLDVRLLSDVKESSGPSARPLSLKPGVASRRRIVAGRTEFRFEPGTASLMPLSPAEKHTARL